MPKPLHPPGLTSAEFSYENGELHVVIADEYGNVKAHYSVACSSPEEGLAIKDQIMEHLRSKGMKPLSDEEVL